MPAVCQAQPAAADGRSAARAGTWRPNPSPNPTPPPKNRQWLIEFRADVQAKRDAGRDATAKRSPTGTRRSRASTPRSTPPGCAATSWAAGRLPSARARPGVARMPRTCPSGPSRTPPSGGPSSLPTAGSTGRRCSSRSPCPPTAGSAPARVCRSIRAPTTTRRRLGTRCTSPSSSTGSCRTFAGWPATTCSTSPPSNRRSGSRRTCTWRSAGPCPARRSRRSPPRPTTRCGGRPSMRSASTVTTCRSGSSGPTWETGPPTRTGRAATTSTRPPGNCCPPGTRRSTSSTPTRRPNRCTWCASVPRSMSRASSPGPRTLTSASAT